MPGLLEKTLERGWRGVVQVGTQERLHALDQTLWTYSENSFLAHGTAKTGFPADQPIYLTTGGDTPNGAGIRFLVDGARAEAFTGFARLVYLFDGQDAEAAGLAREEWKAAKASGCAVTYWQQAADGRWEKKA